MIKATQITWEPIDPKALPKKVEIKEEDLVYRKDDPSDTWTQTGNAIEDYLTEHYGKRFGLKAKKFNYQLGCKN